MRPRERLRGAVELTRPANCIAAGALTFVGAFVAGGIPGDPWAVTAAVLATVLAAGAGNAINDYFDREIDAINRPDRPIPRGAVPPRVAVVQSAVLFAIAVALALTLPAPAIAIAGVNLVLLITYTTWFKGVAGAGNAVVAFLGGSAFLFGGAAVSSMSETIVLFLLAAFATFGREVIKDVEDVQGDRSADLRTLPIVVGANRALWLAAGSLLVATAASPLPYLLDLFDIAYLVAVVPGIALMGYGMATSFDRPGRGQRFVKAGMYLAILAFIVGRIA